MKFPHFKEVNSATTIKMGFVQFILLGVLAISGKTNYFQHKNNKKKLNGLKTIINNVECKKS